MRFLPVFDIRIHHPYYRDKRCPDFSIEPSAHTAASLKNHRSQLLPKADGIQLVTTVDDGDGGVPIIKYADGDRFEFRMRLLNTEFPLFTNLSEIDDLDAPDAPLYTTIANDNNELKLTSRTFSHSETLEVAAPNTEELFVLSGKPKKDLSARDFKITSLAPIHEVIAYNSRGKIITLDSHLANKGDRFLVEYQVQAGGARRAFADIVIHANAILPQLHHPSGDPHVFHINFPAKQTRWAYYCMTDPKHHEAADLKIVDGNTNGSVKLSFSEQHRVDLSDLPAPLDDEVAKDLKRRFPNSHIVRFLSDELIPCQQAARKGLQLLIDGDRLFGSLPNPSPRNYSALKQEYSLYQLVKFL
ncbi:MAG: hypothetical protein GY934_06805 [Gammaproteobacteria bacterium]|nr:hypothetical protein [Gammaproteobacteria bacterium]